MQAILSRFFFIEFKLNISHTFRFRASIQQQQQILYIFHISSTTFFFLKFRVVEKRKKMLHKMKSSRIFMCESVLSMYPKCVDITKRIHFHSSHLITVFEFARKWFNYRDYYTYIVLNGTVCTSKFAKGGVVVAFANWWYFLDILLLLLSLHRFRLTIFDCVILYGCWRELLF